jgi:glycosyltransferase involved in cell wall biosynthesis
VKRKLLIIVENLPVPFDTRVWREANTLRREGYEVTVLCPKGKGYERGYEYLNGIHIYRHPSPKEGNGAAAYIWEYGWALAWECLYTLWIYLRRGFQIIQGCNPPDDIVLIALLFKPFGVKFIFDHHDVNPELYLAKYGRVDLFYKAQLLLEKLTFRFSDVVISTNSSYREIALVRGSVPPEDVFVVRNGPDLETFKAVPPNPAWKCGKSYLVGYVGNMSFQDGLDILLDVAQQLRRLGREDIHFACIGGGSGLTELRKMVLERGLSDFVTFTGRVPDCELLEILSTADLCVNPDRPCAMNDLSTMIKIMEYMALGKPIVQFDLKEGRFSAQGASLYAGYEDGVTAFAEKILWLLDHPEERQKMGDIGRERVQKELAWEFSANKLLEAYDHAFQKVMHKRAFQTDIAKS